MIGMPKNYNKLTVNLISKLRWEPFCANECDLPSSTAVMWYHHAAAGF